MRLRRYLVAGLLVWLPVGTTILVFKVLLDLMDQMLLLLPPDYRPEVVLGFRIPGLGAIFALIVVFVTGMLVANFFGRRFVQWYEMVFQRIPLVRTVYSGVKGFAEVMFSDKHTAFKKVLLIEYPRKGVYSLAFQTSDTTGEVQHLTSETVVTVYLPTTPNPTSGVILFVPRADIVEIDMSVEDALKLIISLGVVGPATLPVRSAAPAVSVTPVPGAGPPA